MAGVGIPKNAETLTGLTASRMSTLMDYTINWKVLARNGLTIELMNELIRNTTFLNADVILLAIGGNDVFKLSSPWKWERHLKESISLLQKRTGNPIILFSNVPPVGQFPAIPNPLR